MIPPHSDAPPRGSRSGTVGYLQALSAAALWGSSGIFAVFLFRRGMSPASVALFRPVVGAAFLLVLAAAGARRAFPSSLRDLAFLGGLGGSLTALFHFAYQSAVDAVGVPTTVALLYLAPAIVVALAGPILGEWPSRRRVGLAVTSVVGVWLTVLGARGVGVSLDPRGIVWGVVTAAGYAGFTIFGRAASGRHEAVATGLWSTVGACVFLGAVLPLTPAKVALPEDPETWGLLVTFGLLTIAVASVLFYGALRRIEAGHAAVVTTVEPVIAALLASWLLRQGLTGWGWVGLTLVVIGVAGSYASGPADETPPAHQ